MVAEISSLLHFQTLLRGNTYLIADFYATWCPPCKQIAPIYNQLSTSHARPERFTFVKVNVDEMREVAAQYGIAAMPTFLLFKNGQKVEEIRGADLRKLQAAVKKAGDDVVALEAQAKQAEVENPLNETVTSSEIQEENTVSGSYSITGGNNWKMSLN